MTVMIDTAAAAPAAAAKKKAAVKKSAVKAVAVAPAAIEPAPVAAAKPAKVAKPAPAAATPKGVWLTPKGKYEVSLFLGAFDSVEEAIEVRTKALEFKTSLKDVRRPPVVTAAIEPEPAAPPAAMIAAPAKAKKGKGKNAAA